MRSWTNTSNTVFELGLQKAFDKRNSVLFYWNANRNRWPGSLLGKKKSFLDVTNQGKMDSYSANQSIFLPHFSGYYRQRDSEFGALVAGTGRVALRLASPFIVPTTKWIGKEMLKQSVPELLNVVSSNKSSKQVLKNTISNKVTNQTGWSQKKNGKTSFALGGPWKIIGQNFSSKLTMIANFLPTETNLRSLDLFEKKNSSLINVWWKFVQNWDQFTVQMDLC